MSVINSDHEVYGWMSQHIRHALRMPNPKPILPLADKHRPILAAFACDREYAALHSINGHAPNLTRFLDGSDNGVCRFTCACHLAFFRKFSAARINAIGLSYCPAMYRIDAPLLCQLLIYVTDRRVPRIQYWPLITLGLRDIRLRLISIYRLPSQSSKRKCSERQ